MNREKLPPQCKRCGYDANALGCHYNPRSGKCARNRPRDTRPHERKPKTCRMCGLDEKACIELVKRHHGKCPKLSEEDWAPLTWQLGGGGSD